MGFQEDFNRALAELTGSGDAAPYTPARKMNLLPIPQRSSMPIDIMPSLPSAMGAVPAPAPSTAGTKQPGQPWWRDALDAMTGVGSIIPNQIADWTDGNLNWKDIPLAESGLKYAKGAFVDPFKEDGFWGGLAQMNPVMQLWNGAKAAGHDAKTTSDVFDNIGWHENKDQPWYSLNNLGHKAASFVGDVALDPTTYVTFGGASALKAGAKAMAEEAAIQAAKHGVTDVAKGGVESVAKKTADAVYKKTMDEFTPALKYTKPDVAPDLAKKLAQKKSDEVFNAIENAGKGARNKAQNSLLNIDVPFTRITKQIGEKPDFLKIKDALVGTAGAAVVTNKLANLGLKDAEQAKLLQKAYGVSDPAHMTSQMLDHFNSVIEKIGKTADLPKEKVAETINQYMTHVEPFVDYKRFNADEFLQGKTPYVNHKMEGNIKAANAPVESPAILGNQRSFLDNFDQMLKTVPDQAVKDAKAINKASGGGNAGHMVQGADLKAAGQELKNASHTAEIRLKPTGDVTYDATRNVSFEPSTKGAKVAKKADKVFEANKFVQDMGGKSALGKIVGDKLFKSVNARTLGSADQFVNQAAGHIRDAEGMIRGNTAQLARDVRRIDRIAKGLSESDLKKIPYFLENKAPGKAKMEDFLKDVTDRKRFDRVAGEMKALFDRFAKEEKGVGALSKSIQDYFPHVISKTKLSSDELEKLLQDPEIAKLMGRSAKNNFDQARKGFRTFADWKDAISGLEKEIAKMPDGDAKDALIKKLSHLEGVFEENSVKAMTERYQKHVRSTAMTKLYNTFKGNGMIVTKGQRIGQHFKGDIKEYERITPELQQKLGLKKDMIGSSIHRDVLKGLERVQGIFTDAGMNKVLDTLTSVTNIWKPLVTSYNATHHWFNLVGNVANNTLAGVGIGAYRKAGTLVAKMKAGKLTAEEKKFIQEAYDNGILASGSMADVHDPLRLAAKHKGPIGKAEDFMANNPYAKGARFVGDTIDDFSRLAHYIQIRKTTGSAKLATESVRKYLFNYGELTNADRAIKVIAPFWTWTKNNLPRQIQEFVRQPRYYQTYVRAQEAFQGDANLSLDPSYTIDSFLTGSDGKKHTFYNPRLPLTDLTSINDPLSMGLNMLNPLAKIPIELKMNKQFFNGAPIDPANTTDKFSDYSGSALGKYALQQTGIGSKMANIDPAHLETLIFGKPMVIDQAKQKQRAYYEKRDKKLAEKKKRVKKAQSGGN